MTDAGQNGHRGEPSRHQEKPVKRQREQRLLRAHPHPPAQKQRQPSGQRPFVAELEKQQQREQNRPETSEIAKRLAERGLRGYRRLAVRSARVETANIAGAAAINTRITETGA